MHARLTILLASLLCIQATPLGSQSTPANLGLFTGQTDIGNATPPGSAIYAPAHHTYTITSAGYNIWYARDEFHYLWKKTSGDLSLAADIDFPNPASYKGAKAVLMIRQSLDDNAMEAAAAMHSDGTTILQFRPQTGGESKALDFRIVRKETHPGIPPEPGERQLPKRLRLEKHGDAFTLSVSLNGEPLHPFGPPIHLHLAQPFYVGIGFGSHVKDVPDRAIFSNVDLTQP
jgi:hypothetical protein